jgi:hypothetical protein
MLAKLGACKRLRAVIQSVGYCSKGLRMKSKDVQFSVIDSTNAQLGDAFASCHKQQAQEEIIHCAYVADEEQE